MSRLFGTDGVRGRAGTELTADLAFRISAAAAGYFTERGVREAYVARDTRLSGGMLSAAVLSGLASVGVEAVDLEIAPTPAVSSLVGSSGARAFGVVVSASHNPYEDNGIKFFSPDGGKLGVPEEEAIERRVRMITEPAASHTEVGKIRRDPARVESYIRSLRARFPVRLKKTVIHVDAAHGAWAPHAAALFSGPAGLAPGVELLNCDFNGADINAGCGSTHIESLDTRLGPSSVGLAFDGDGDRMLIRISDLNPKSQIPNPKIQTLDGDALLFLFAKHFVTSGPIVGTVMSNGALAAALEKMGRAFHRASVGDREVYEAMSLHGADLGGEQSGHIIFRAFQRTGDGAATALAFLKIFVENYGESIEALIRDIPRPFPQKLVNLRVAEKPPWEADLELSRDVESAREKLGPHGRLIIRYSGTEPLLRLMAESPSAAAVEDQLAFLETAFRKRLP